MFRQKSGESAKEFGFRVDKLAIELYQSMVEGHELTAEQRKAILDTIQEQALGIFQLRLRKELQRIVRSRNYSNLTAATLGVAAEEKLKGPVVQARNSANRGFEQGQEHPQQAENSKR